MNIYKITNISGNIGKRDPNYNSTLMLNYINKLKKEKLLIKPGETVYLSIDKLPISAHSLRVKNLISVSEISEAELKKALPKKKQVEKQVPSKSSVSSKTTKKTDENTTKKTDENTTKKTDENTTKKTTAKKTTKKTDEGYFSHTVND